MAGNGWEGSSERATVPEGIERAITPSSAAARHGRIFLSFLLTLAFEYNSTRTDLNVDHISAF